MLALVKQAIEKTGCRNVCLAGGVALNSKANGKIQASGIVDHIFIQPAGFPTMAWRSARCLLLLDGGGPDCHETAFATAYLGPNFPMRKLKKALRTYKLRAAKLNDVCRNHGRTSGQWKYHRLVSGTNGVWARARSDIVDPGRMPARSGNER